MFTQDEGGFQSSTMDDLPYKEIYFVGIVDIFQEYTIIKQLEQAYKIKKFDLSPVCIFFQKNLYKKFLEIFITKINSINNYQNIILLFIFLKFNLINS